MNAARRTHRVWFTQFLSALRVSVLVAGGKVEAAVRAWPVGQLPGSDAECVDINTQSWCQAEMLACTRLRLLIAQGELEASREFVEVFLTAARQRKLVRMTMRGLALTLALEYRPGNKSYAWTQLAAYLQLYAKTGYARPLAHDRGAAQQLIDEVA